MFEASVGRGALWAALSRTGTSQHAPLLLSLDVRGPNDLAAKASLALEGGMSQSELEAILASTTPVKPQAVEGRKDHPTWFATSSKASLTLALAAAQPNQRRQSLEALDSDMLAKSTKPASDSRLRTFLAICSAWEIQAFPLTPECIRCVGASLKAGGYKSAALYFQTAVSHQLRTQGIPTSHFLRSMIRDVVRSVKRGLGPSQLKAGFDMAALARVIDCRDDSPFDMGRVPHMADLMVICGWFMLREIEISFARDSHLSLTGMEVTLMVPVHKTNTHGALTVRTLRCACGIREELLCPWHAAERHVIRLSQHPERRQLRYFPLFPNTNGEAVTKYLFVKCLRQTLQQAGVDTVVRQDSGRELELYGGHSLRVAGAQFLAAAGVQTSLIQLLGRWSSMAIERYVQTAPLSVVPQLPTEVLRSKQDATEENRMASPSTPALASIPPTPKVAPYPHHRDSVHHVRMISDPAEGQDSSFESPAVGRRDEAQLAAHSAELASLRREITTLAKAVQPPDEVRVLRPRSSVVHRSLVDEIQNPPAQWRTRCGWRYGLARFFRVSVMADTQRFCRKCFDLQGTDDVPPSGDSGEDSSSSSSSASSSTPSS